jgi:hypothetical protein
MIARLMYLAPVLLVLFILTAAGYWLAFAAYVLLTLGLALEDDRDDK